VSLQPEERKAAYDQKQRRANEGQRDSLLIERHRTAA